jgi:hypothetical protein
MQTIALYLTSFYTIVLLTFYYRDQCVKGFEIRQVELVQLYQYCHDRQAVSTAYSPLLPTITVKTRKGVSSLVWTLASFVVLLKLDTLITTKTWQILSSKRLDD